MTNQRLAYAGFMLLAAFAFFFVRRISPWVPGMAKLPWTHRFCLGAAGFVGGVFGARLPFVVGVNLESSNWLADGKTITTGLIGAYLAVELVKFLLGIRIKTGDSFALPLAFAISIGRWGCFFNGCCAGTPTDLPWGVDFGDGVKRHPTQAYESLFHLAMAGVIVLPWVNRNLIGHRLQLYLITYAVYRFATEFIRPEPAYLAGLTFYQWASVVLGAGLAGQWCWEWQRNRTFRTDIKNPSRECSLSRERPPGESPIRTGPEANSRNRESE